MAEEGKDFGAIGEEILFAARNELYMNLPYLDVALCGLRFAPGDEVTLSIATDGQTLYYSGSWLAERYLRSRVLTNRAYLHVILHCMLRHLAKKRGKAAELWDLACDVAVESILSELEYPCLDEGTVPMKQKFFGECRQEMPVLTAFLWVAGAINGRDYLGKDGRTLENLGFPAGMSMEEIFQQL